MDDDLDWKGHGGREAQGQSLTKPLRGGHGPIRNGGEKNDASGNYFSMKAISRKNATAALGVDGHIINI